MFCVATAAAIFMEINFLAKFGQKEKDQFTSDCDIYGKQTNNGL